MQSITARVHTFRFCFVVVSYKFSYQVATKIENVFSKFKLMLLKKDEASKANLLSILRKINDHLEDKQSRFLTGETMCCFDCELMPKLQHIRVAGEFFTDFHIPGKAQ